MPKLHKFNSRAANLYVAFFFLWNIFIIFAYNIQILNLFFQSIDKTLFSVI